MTNLSQGVYGAVYVDDGEITATFDKLQDVLDFVYDQRMPNNETVYSVCFQMENGICCCIYNAYLTQKYIDRRLHDEQAEAEEERNIRPDPIDPWLYVR